MTIWLWCYLATKLLGTPTALLARQDVRALPIILRDLVLEFGPAAALDSMLLRPALMYAGATLASSTALGIVAGKIAADVCFYAPAIASYELLCRRWPAIEERAVFGHRKILFLSP